MRRTDIRKPPLREGARPGLRPRRRLAAACGPSWNSRNRIRSGLEPGDEIHSTAAPYPPLSRRSIAAPARLDAPSAASLYALHPIRLDPPDIPPGFRVPVPNAGRIECPLTNRGRGADPHECRFPKAWRPGERERAVRRRRGDAGASADALVLGRSENIPRAVARRESPRAESCPVARKAAPSRAPRLFSTPLLADPKMNDSPQAVAP